MTPLFWLLVAQIAVATAAAPCSVELSVIANVTTYDASSTSGALGSDVFEVSVRNSGRATITLVEPGDGSGNGRRTPITTWEVELVGSSYSAPKLGYCGNINPLTAGEVFELEPGQSHVFGSWVPPVFATEPGTYRVRFKYVNDPLLRWGGIPLSEHDPKAMQRVRTSTACSALSNQVEVLVTAVHPK